MAGENRQDTGGCCVICQGEAYHIARRGILEKISGIVYFGITIGLQVSWALTLLIGKSGIMRVK